MTPAELRARLRAGTVTPEICQAAADGWEAAEAENARLREDKTGLQNQVGKLLSMLDDWDSERAAETGGFTMHVYGNTPDWFVEAAHWASYGFSYGDPRAALTTGATE